MCGSEGDPQRAPLADPREVRFDQVRADFRMGIRLISLCADPRGILIDQARANLQVVNHPNRAPCRRLVAWGRLRLTMNFTNSSKPVLKHPPPTTSAAARSRSVWNVFQGHSGAAKGRPDTATTRHA